MSPAAVLQAWQREKSSPKGPRELIGSGTHSDCADDEGLAFSAQVFRYQVEHPVGEGHFTKAG